MHTKSYFHFLTAIAFSAALSLLFLTNSASAVDVTLGWDPNNEADLEGYGIYYQKDNPGPPYNLFGYVTLAELADPSNPTITVTGLDAGAVYQFALTAYDTADNESGFSIPVCAEIGDVIVAVPCPTGDTGGGGSSAGGSGGGGGGGGCFIGAVGGENAPSVRSTLIGLSLLGFIGFLKVLKFRVE